MTLFKTLIHNLVEPMDKDDKELTSHLTNGWQIYNFTIVGPANDTPAQRIVTLIKVIADEDLF